MKPSKATFWISTFSGIAERSPYVVSTIAVFGLILSGLRRSKVTAAFSTRRPARSSRTDIRQSSSTAIRVPRQSGAGSDVVVHQPDPVEALLVRRLHAEVEAAGAAEVLLGPDHLQRQVGCTRPSSTVCVWSVLALSTTITASGRCSDAARPPSIRSSRPARL